MSKPHFTRIPHWLLPHLVEGTIQTGALTVYLAVGQYVNYRTGRGAFPSVDTLAKDTGISERSVQRHLKSLEGVGAIVRKARFVKGQQSSNMITLILDEPGEGEGGDTGDTPRGDTGDTLTRSTEQEAAAVVEEPPTAAADEQDEPEPQPESEPDQQQQEQVISRDEVRHTCGPCGTEVGMDQISEMTAEGVVICVTCGRAPASMEDAVAIVQERLGGTVIGQVSHGETPGAEEATAAHAAALGLPEHDPQGPRAQHHGGQRYTVADDPRVQRPFPTVEQRKLVGWFGVGQQEGSAWEAAWQAADMATARAVEGDQFYYDPEAHLAIYLSRCRSENRKPRADLWLRFFIEDRAKHIQTLREEHEKSLRHDEDPAEREGRSMATLPPQNWGIPEEG